MLPEAVAVPPDVYDVAVVDEPIDRLHSSQRLIAGLAALWPRTAVGPRGMTSQIRGRIRSS